MRLVFFGSGEFGCPTLQRLVRGDHEIAAVFTRPDLPAGRGRLLTSTPIKKLAREFRLPVHEHVDPNDQKTIDYVRSLAPTIGIVVDYGHLIHPDLFNLPPEGFINLHASLLPAYRGAAPVPHAILDGAAETGVTAFRINARFDEGDVLGRVKAPVLPTDTSAALLERLAPLGAQLLMEILGRLEAGWLTPVPQDGGTPSRAPKFRKESGRMAWRLPGYMLERQVRALQPWPLSFTVLPTRRGAMRVNVLAADAMSDDEIEAGAAGQSRPAASSRYRGLSEPLRPQDATRLCGWDPLVCDAPRPGTIVSADQRFGLVIRVGDGMLRLTRIKPEGRSAMGDKDFVRGTRVECGACLL